MPWRVLVALFCGIAGAACSLGALDGFSGGQDDAGPNAEASADAPTGEGAAASDGGGGESSGPPSLVTNGGFEEGSAACGPGWRTDRTTMSRATTKKGGMYGCLVCGTPGNPVGNVFPQNAVLAAAKAGDGFYAEAWVAAPPTGATATMAMQMSIDSANLDYNSVLPQPSYQLVQLQGTADADGQLYFALRLNNPPAGTGCYLVDDIVVIRQ